MGRRQSLQVKRTYAPLQQAGQGRPGQFTLRFMLPIGENGVQFMRRRGRQDQGIAFALEDFPELVGEVLAFG